MGGCGTAICLFIALILFSKHKSNRKSSKMAFFPMIFNINEILIFGLPIVFNPIFLIPFILTHSVIFMTSFSAISLGLVTVVKLCDKQRKFIVQKRLDSLIKFIKNQETIISNYSLLNHPPAELRLVAQMIISDLNTALQNKDIRIYYQPNIIKTTLI